MLLFRRLRDGLGLLKDGINEVNYVLKGNVHSTGLGVWSCGFGVYAVMPLQQHGCFITVFDNAKATKLPRTVGYGRVLIPRGSNTLMRLLYEGESGGHAIHDFMIASGYLSGKG